MGLNIAAGFVMVLLIFELYFLTAGSQHRKKKCLKGWNRTTGIIRSMEKKYDSIGHKNYIELTIEGPEGRTVYGRVGTLNIYEEGEEVELMEKDGYHRFLGNDRVDQKGKKEQLIGTIPMLVVIVIAALLTLLFRG